MQKYGKSAAGLFLLIAVLLGAHWAFAQEGPGRGPGGDGAEGPLRRLREENVQLREKLDDVVRRTREEIEGLREKLEGAVRARREDNQGPKVELELVDGTVLEALNQLRAQGLNLALNQGVGELDHKISLWIKGAALRQAAMAVMVAAQLRCDWVGDVLVVIGPQEEMQQERHLNWLKRQIEIQELEGELNEMQREGEGEKRGAEMEFSEEKENHEEE